MVSPMPEFLLVLPGAGSMCSPRKSRNGSGRGGLFVVFGIVMEITPGGAALFLHLSSVTSLCN